MSEPGNAPCEGKWVAKGDRVRARWIKLKDDPPSSLAGGQLKYSGESQEVIGRVKSIRGDRAVDPREAILFVVPDGAPDTEEVPVRPEWIVEIFPAKAAS